MKKSELRKIIKEELLKESLKEGSVKLFDSDCSQIPALKKIILDAYNKVSKKEGVDLKPWSSNENKYDILRKDNDKTLKAIEKQLGGRTVLIHDRVEVSYSLRSKTLILSFNGMDLKKEVKVKY